jgi:hypothetical protein
LLCGGVKLGTGGDYHFGLLAASGKVGGKQQTADGGQQTANSKQPDRATPTIHSFQLTAAWLFTVYCLLSAVCCLLFAAYFSLAANNPK